MLTAQYKVCRYSQDTPRVQSTATTDQIKGLSSDWTSGNNNWPRTLKIFVSLSKLIINLSDIQEIVELLEGFALNRTLPRSHMRERLANVHKPILLKKWKAEATYHQRLMFKMVKEFHDLEYYDEEIWNLLAFDIAHKKMINNTPFFDLFYRTFNELNKDPSKPFFKKFDSAI